MEAGKEKDKEPEQEMGNIYHWLFPPEEVAKKKRTRIHTLNIWAPEVLMDSASQGAPKDQLNYLFINPHTAC